MEIKLHWQMTEAEVAELYRVGRAEGALTVVAYDARRLDLTLFEAFARRAEVFGAVYEGGYSPGLFLSDRL
ncbi:MAG: hypothetical protein LBP55_08520 [Candidatus Adiutrix sp.]|nr:hypothetical protein [Candidatus Adiutrix sp.]